VVQLLLALTLAETPEEASRNCQWGSRFLWRDDDLAASTCADALIRRGRDWSAEFVRLATEARFRGESQRGVGEVVALVSAAIAAHDLPMPLTETYVRGWVSLITFAHSYAMADNRRDWHPLVDMTAQEGTARPAYNLSENLTLSECLAGTRSLSELLVAGLATPNALLDWAGFREEGWAVGPAIRYAVSTGLVDRQPLLDGTFSALSRDDRANNQRVLAEFLKALDPTPAEIKHRASLILHVLPTVQGSVTKPLLEMALAADFTEEDLVELGLVILARPEKAQKVTLLSHLAPVDSPAREPLLTVAMDSDDAALAAKARALLGSRTAVGSDVGAPSAAGLPPWSLRVEPFQPGPFTPYAANEAALDEARSDEETWSRITSEAAYLDLVVRFAHRDLHRLREVVSSAPDPNWYSLVRTPFLLHQWVKTGNGTRSYQRTSTSHRFSGDWSTPIIETHTFEMRPPAHLLFTDRLVEETLTRLGPLTELLSTPSRSDGTLEVQVLAKRVQAARTVGYGPYDLVQALLRLGPTRPSDIRLFDGLALAPAGQSAPRRSWLARGPRSAGTMTPSRSSGTGSPRAVGHHETWTSPL